MSKDKQTDCRRFKMWVYLLPEAPAESRKSRNPRRCHCRTPCFHCQYGRRRGTNFKAEGEVIPCRLVIIDELATPCGGQVITSRDWWPIWVKVKILCWKITLVKVKDSNIQHLETGRENHCSAAKPCTWTPLHRALCSNTNTRQRTHHHTPVDRQTDR